MNIIYFIWNLPRIILSYLVLKLGMWLEIIDIIYDEEEEEIDDKKEK